MPMIFQTNHDHAIRPWSFTHLYPRSRVVGSEPMSPLVTDPVSGLASKPVGPLEPPARNYLAGISIGSTEQAIDRTCSPWRLEEWQFLKLVRGGLKSQ